MKKKNIINLGLIIGICIGFVLAAFSPAIIEAAAELDKIVTIGGSRGATIPLYDEDDMASDSAKGVCTQQSLVAYVTAGTAALTNKTLASPTITGVMILGGATADPCDGATTTGAIFYDTAGDKTCYCDSNGDDLEMSDGSTCY